MEVSNDLLDLELVYLTFLRYLNLFWKQVFLSGEIEWFIKPKKHALKTSSVY
jgi:hypothetical protein